MVVDGIIEALTSVGGSEPEDLAACALALTTMLRAPTRKLIEEWLDRPAVTNNGLTARQMIREGKAADLAQGLWSYVDELGGGLAV